MPDAPRLRPDKHTVLHTFSATIGAEPDAVFLVLHARLSAAMLAGSAYFADQAELLIVSQGAWWYRAEYRVVADARGSRLDHQIINVAQRGERAALIAGRKAVAGAPLAFHDLVKAIRSTVE